MRRAAKEKICPDCGEVFAIRYARVCLACTLARDVYRIWGSGQTLAIAAVMKAQAKGLLPRPSTVKCFDCGRQAEVHEHRDYSRPLDVVQVCKSCNRKRGMAKRKDWTFDEFWEYFKSIPAGNCLPYGSLAKEHFEPIRRKYFSEAA